MLLRWLIFAVLVLLGGLTTIGNWSAPIISAKKHRNVSLIPLFGGALLAIACGIAPIEGLHAFWWLPLVFDLGCGPMLVALACHLIWHITLGGQK